MMQERGVNCRSKLLSRQKRVGCNAQLGEPDLDRSWDKLSFVISGKEQIWVRLQGRWLTLLWEYVAILLRLIPFSP